MSGDQHVTFDVMEAYVAHTLPEQGCLAVEEHIADCRQCLKQVQALRGLEPLWQSWTIASHVAAARQVSPSRGKSVLEKVSDFFRARTTSMWLTTGGLATAAACALLLLVAHLSPSHHGTDRMLASAPPSEKPAVPAPMEQVKPEPTIEATPPQRQQTQAPNPPQHGTETQQSIPHRSSHVAGMYIPIRRSGRVTATHPRAKADTELQYLAMLPPQLETRGMSPEPKASPDRTVVLSQTPTLTVKDSSFAGPYRFQIDEGQWEGGEFVVTKPEIVKAETDKAEYAVSKPLARGKIYRWQMTSAQKESPKPIGGTFMVSTEKTFVVARAFEQEIPAPGTMHSDALKKLVAFYIAHGLYQDGSEVIAKLLSRADANQRVELTQLQEKIERAWK